MSALSDREAAATPLLAIHERLDELTLAIDAVVTLLDPGAGDEAVAEAIERATALHAAAARIRGQAASGDPGEWFAASGAPS